MTTERCEQCGRKIWGDLAGTYAVARADDVRPPAPMALDGRTCRVCLAAAGYQPATREDAES